MRTEVITQLHACYLQALDWWYRTHTHTTETEMDEKRYALLGRRGDIGGRWLASQSREMYSAGVRHAMLTRDAMQVWRVASDGTLAWYDAALTAKLTKKIVEALRYRADAIAKAR